MKYLYGVLLGLVVVTAVGYGVYYVRSGTPMHSIPSGDTERVVCGSTAPPVYCARYRCSTGFSSAPVVPGGVPQCADGSVPTNLGVETTGQSPQPYPSSGGMLSLKEAYNNGACDIHILNAETKKESVIKGAVANAEPEDCDSFCTPSLSSHGMYVVNDCGTSPDRTFSIFAMSSGEHLQSVSARQLLWLDDTHVLFDALQPSGGWESNCTSGGEAGIVIEDLAQGRIDTLKHADRDHSYRLGIYVPSSDTITYELSTLPAPESCSQVPVTTYWVMDRNGTTLRPTTSSAWRDALR